MLKSVLQAKIERLLGNVYLALSHVLSNLDCFSYGKY